MIRASGRTGDGKPLLLLGLSDENWRRMREHGEPILFEAAELDHPIHVVIVGGPDEESIRAELKEWFTVHHWLARHAPRASTSPCNANDGGFFCARPFGHPGEEHESCGGHRWVAGSSYQ